MRRSRKNEEMWLQTFAECHEYGPKEFGGLWLTANANALYLVHYFGIDPSTVQMKAFISRIILSVLRTAYPAPSNPEGGEK